MKQRILIAMLGAAIFVGCKDDIAEVDMGYAYYPATIGSWISYQVDSIRHYSDENADTVHYQIRELIESEFVDEGGRPARRIERYYRNNGNEPWTIKDIWMVIVNNRKVEKVEENIRYVRLNFPVKTDQYWDGNALNDLDPWEYNYSSVNESAISGGASFAQCATVEQKGAVNLIEQERGREIYTSGIGLIYKELVEIKTDVNYQSNPTTENIQSGYELYYQYLSHGQN